MTSLSDRRLPPLQQRELLARDGYAGKEEMRPIYAQFTSGR
jgi:hypothetical protein